MNIIKRLLNDKLILLLIIINSIVIFLQGFDTLNIRYLNILDQLLTFIFIIEVIVNIKYYTFSKYISNNWNRFDFILIILSLPSFITFITGLETIDISYLLIFRVFRAFKLFRTFKFIKNIDNLLSGVMRALKASIVILITFIMYLFIIGILSYSMFHYNENFSNPLESVYSILKIFTMENWYGFADELAVGESMYKAFFIKLYFVIILLSGGIFGLALINSIFVDAMMSDDNDDLIIKVGELEKKIDKLLEK